MHESIEGLQGVEVIADDFLVCGFGGTIDEAVKDHDQNLTAFLQTLICQKGSLMVMSHPLCRPYLDETHAETEYCNELEEVVLVEDLPFQKRD